MRFFLRRGRIGQGRRRTIDQAVRAELSEIKGVEYVYSISRPGGALIIVRFYVGQPMEQSLVDLYDKLMSNQDLFAAGCRAFPGEAEGYQ